MEHLGIEDRAGIVSESTLDKNNKKAERVGFEPTVKFYPHTRLAGECLQPARPPLRRLRKSKFQNSKNKIQKENILFSFGFFLSDFSSSA